MIKLSSAAQAAVNAAVEAGGGYGKATPVLHARLAAALVAVADQVVPEPDDWDKDNFSVQALRLRCLMRDQLLAIAAELRGTTTTETP
jgi:hypothetical protein